MNNRQKELVKELNLKQNELNNNKLYFKSLNGTDRTKLAREIKKIEGEIRVIRTYLKKVKRS